MALKFFRVSAANAEIERLAGEVSSLTKERDDLKAALEANAADTTKAAEDIQAQLVTANKTVESLTAEVSTSKAALEKATADLAEATKKLENPAEQVAKLAAQKAAEITAAQGQPAIQTAAAGTPDGSASGVIEQWQAISDPREKTAFWKKNQKAIEAAWKPTRKE
jgi:chromosome segregation ATPase